MAKKEKKVVTTTTVTTTTTSTTPKTVYDFFVLDRSGSMSSILDSTINGFNEYIGTAKRDAKDNGLKSFASAILFDDQFEYPYTNVPIDKVLPLTRQTFVPRGWTALNDAVAKAITSLKGTLAGREADPNIDVTITVFTDGDENKSIEFPNNYARENQALKAMVKQVQDDWGWTVSYVGAGTREHAAYVSQHLGIKAANFMSYTADAVGTSNAFTSLESARSLKSSNFSAGIKSNDGYLSNTTTVVDPVDDPTPPTP